MKLRVVIVNYQTEEHVLRCLDSLERHVETPYEVLVVDNSPAPETSRIRAAFPAVSIERPGSNLGFAGGSNVGLRRALEARDDFALLLNPDTYATSDFLAPLVELLDSEPTIAAASPKILKAATDEIYFGGARMHWLLGGPRHVTDRRFDGRSWVPMPFLTGCALLLRTDAVRRLGLLDEGYFLYFEDADYVRRLSAKDFEAGYVPSAELFHVESASIDRKGARHTFLFARSRMIFMRRWATRTQLAVFLAYTLFVKVPGALVIFGLLRRRPRQSWAFLKGCWRGLWS